MVYSFIGFLHQPGTNSASLTFLSLPSNSDNFIPCKLFVKKKFLWTLEIDKAINVAGESNKVKEIRQRWFIHFNSITEMFIAFILCCSTSPPTWSEFLEFCCVTNALSKWDDIKNSLTTIETYIIEKHYKHVKFLTLAKWQDFHTAKVQYIRRDTRLFNYNLNDS